MHKHPALFGSAFPTFSSPKLCDLEEVVGHEVPERHDAAEAVRVAEARTLRVLLLPVGPKHLFCVLFLPRFRGVGAAGAKIEGTEIASAVLFTAVVAAQVAEY